MSEIGGKVEHVRQAAQDRRHGCHWPGCDQQVPPAMWGCKRHWFKLPKRLRDRIWQEYVPGQEQRMDPSDGYLEVAREVQAWIEENFPSRRCPACGGRGWRLDLDEPCSCRERGGLARA